MMRELFQVKRYLGASVEVSIRRQEDVTLSQRSGFPVPRAVFASSSNRGHEAAKTPGSDMGLVSRSCFGSGPQDYRDPLAGFNQVAVGRNDGIAIGAHYGGDVSRSLPAHQLHVTIFEFAAENGRQKALQPGLGSYRGLQLCPRK